MRSHTVLEPHGHRLRPYLLLFLLSFPLWYAGLVLRGRKGPARPQPHRPAHPPGAGLAVRAHRPRGRPGLSGDCRPRGPTLRELPAGALARRGAARRSLRRSDPERALRHLRLLARRSRRPVRAPGATRLRRALGRAREPRLRLRHESLRDVRAGQRLGLRSEPRLLPGRDRPPLRTGERGKELGTRLSPSRSRRGLPSPARPALPPLPDPRPPYLGALRGRGAAGGPALGRARRPRPRRLQRRALRQPARVRAQPPRLGPSAARGHLQPRVSPLEYLPRARPPSRVAPRMAAPALRHRGHGPLAQQRAPGDRDLWAGFPPVRPLGARGLCLLPREHRP